MSKTMDSTTLTSEKLEFATVGRTKEGTIYHHQWAADEIDALLKEHGLGKKEESEPGTTSAATNAENRPEGAPTAGVH